MHSPAVVSRSSQFTRNMGADKVISPAEVAKHTEKSSGANADRVLAEPRAAWLIVEGNVYDVTEFLFVRSPLTPLMRCKA